MNCSMCGKEIKDGENVNQLRGGKGNVVLIDRLCDNCCGLQRGKRAKTGAIDDYCDCDINLKCGF